MPAARQEETPSLGRMDVDLKKQFSSRLALGLGPRLGVGVRTPYSELQSGEPTPTPTSLVPLSGSLQWATVEVFIP